MSSGTISVFSGMLPEMNTTDPYSPSARANERANPVSSVGSMAGAITRASTRRRPAPSTAAASSMAGSRSRRTGWSVRTTKGSPTKVRATTTPAGAKATWTPFATRWRPMKPFSAYTAVSAMPATAVGSANGRSTSASASALPGNRYRVSTHASTDPKTRLISAPRREAKKLSRYAARARGPLTAAANCAQESCVERSTSAPSGSSTTRLR